MTEKTPGQIKAEAAEYIRENGSKEILPEAIRNRLNDICDSFVPREYGGGPNLPLAAAVDELVGQLADGTVVRITDDNLAAQMSQTIQPLVAAAAASATAATDARDAVLLSKGLFATTAAAMGLGVIGNGPITGGSGGANGTFDLAFIGGTGSGAAGRFVVAGGALVAILISAPGSYTVAPTFDFSASAGLVGASATCVLGVNVDVGEYFSTPSVADEELFFLWRVDAGPVATLVKPYSIVIKDNISTSRAVVEFRDVAGNFISGDLRDGRRMITRNAPEFYVQKDAYGKDQIFVSHFGRSTKLTSVGENWAPRLIAGPLVRYMSTSRGFPEPWTMKEDGSGKQPLVSVYCYDAPGYGQSPDISGGFAVGTATAVDTVNFNANALMLDTGLNSPIIPAAIAVTNRDWTMNPASIGAAFVPLREAVVDNTVGGQTHEYGQTSSTTFAAEFLRGIDPAALKLVCGHFGRASAGYYGSDGSPPTRIKADSVHFANFRMGGELTRRRAVANGWRYEYLNTRLKHGHADASPVYFVGGVLTTRGQYASYMPELCDHINALHRSDSLYARRAPMLMAQFSTSNSISEPGWWNIANAMVDAALADDRLIIYAPQYPYPHQGDEIHITTEAQRSLGDLEGDWSREAMFGRHRKPFVFYEAKLISASPYTFRLRAYVPVGALAVNTTDVAARTNNGIEYSDGSAGGITITSVALSAGYTDAVDVVMSGNPLVQTNPKFSIAKTPSTANTTGATTGARCNFCDSNTEVGLLTGRVKRNWMLHHEVVPTT